MNVKLFDTTLRDGSQSENISFSVEDKLHIAHKLDEFGIHYIEGGWPGSNPKDMLFFKQVQKETFQNARIVAFGSTKHAKNPVENDPNIRALLEAETPIVSLFGKTWIYHVEYALRVSREENLHMIGESVATLKAHNREVIFDAEHFFDGYKDNPDYAMACIKSAEKAGADVIVLCDTNGGTLTHDIAKIVRAVKSAIKSPLGIHAHNDSELAVANSIEAVINGCEHVQGTINGYGERCGNANLCSIIPNLQLKAGYYCIPDENIKKLTALANYVSEIANLTLSNTMPYTGKSAFTHKGGVHVSAVMRKPECYEHISPEIVGNKRRVLISDLAGKSNILFKSSELGLDLTSDKERIPEIVKRLKELENEGYEFEAAESSLELLIKRMKHEFPNFFSIQGFRILNEKDENAEIRSEATVRAKVDGQEEHTAAEGVGPVNALDKALRRALTKFYPEIEEMKLSDYKVRVINAWAGTSAKVRVLIESTSHGKTWTTVGVSENIIEASWQALIDSISYFLMKRHQKRETLET
ncbi:MAG: citramalate synthase [Candidatus Marinimicrobia bacterium]|nr:citramalate synthase [Candidatus Neomarinimicrobiota bacterium]MDD5582843.1 citramalate synthase [Candidatus Neomarinimicrobiota bacterium]